MQASQATSSAVFVVNALEKILNTKEARKNKTLNEAVRNAHSMFLFAIKQCNIPN